jgi:hypothetical protein
LGVDVGLLERVIVHVAKEKTRPKPGFSQSQEAMD